MLMYIKTYIITVQNLNIFFPVPYMSSITMLQMSLHIGACREIDRSPLFVGWQNQRVPKQFATDRHVGSFNVLLLPRMLHPCVDISEHLQASFCMTNFYIYNCISKGVYVFIFTGTLKLPHKKFCTNLYSLKQCMNSCLPKYKPILSIIKIFNFC